MDKIYAITKITKESGIAISILSAGAKRMQRSGIAISILSAGAKRMQRSGIAISITQYRGDAYATTKRSGIAWQ